MPKSVIMVGPVPPPVHGAANVTIAVAKLLTDAQMEVYLNDVSGNGKTRLSHHLTRIARYAVAMRNIAFSRNPRTVYVCLSGGLGLLYDLLVVCIGLLRKTHLVFHHHSYAYINHRSFLMHVLTSVAPKSTHVLLCQDMADKFSKLYKQPNVHAISNLAFLDLETHIYPTRGALKRIGFISNLLPEKGVDQFVKFVELLRQRGITIEACIAGPLMDRADSSDLLQRCKALGISYIGPVDADKKMAFFESIDYMIFPTRYANEAEPLVVLEAHAAGVPVAASSRGCLPCMLQASNEFILDDMGNNIEELLPLIVKLHQDQALYRECTASVTERHLAISQGKVSMRATFLTLFDHPKTLGATKTS